MITDMQRYHFTKAIRDGMKAWKSEVYSRADEHALTCFSTIVVMKKAYQMEFEVPYDQINPGGLKVVVDNLRRSANEILNQNTLVV